MAMQCICKQIPVKINEIYTDVTLDDRLLYVCLSVWLSTSIYGMVIIENCVRHFLMKFRLIMITFALKYSRDFQTINHRALVLCELQQKINNFKCFVSIPQFGVSSLYYISVTLMESYNNDHHIKIKNLTLETYMKQLSSS